MKVFVLKVRMTGEEDEVFLFRLLQDARTKVYEYFEEEPPKKITTIDMNKLEERYFEHDKGYFTIREQKIN
jgi:hypothetical protein